MPITSGTSRVIHSRVDRRQLGVCGAQSDSRRRAASAGREAEVASSGPADLLSVAQKLIVTIIATTVLAACTSEKAAAPSTSPSASASSATEIKAEVIAAWRAEHEAYADALRALNPNDPALAQSAINPALQRAKAYIAVAKAQGIVVRGSQDLGTPKVVSLTPASDPTQAVVESCVRDGLILINGKTDKPVPGLSGQVTWNFEHTILTLVEGVGWMVSDNVVKQDLKESVCAGS